MSDKPKTKRVKKPSPLKNWKSYKNFYNSYNGLSPLDAENSKLNRFEARYSLASKFQGIKADGITPKTLRGYDAGMRLLLAYTAAELLCKVIGENVNEWNVRDKKLAKNLKMMLSGYNKKIKSNNKKQKNITVILNKNTPIGLFNDFLENDHSDIRIVATAIRIGMAHGPFNPNSFDVRKTGDAELINQLAAKMLAQCQQKFNKWFKEEKAKYKNN
jgi:hypothetical protein